MTNRKQRRFWFALAVASVLLAASTLSAQDRHDHGPAKPITVPVTIRVKKTAPEVEMRIVDFLLREDGEQQTILSIRRPVDSPLSLAILIQDDLVSSIGNDIKNIAEFIRHQTGSRIMIGYIRSGSLDVRRKFTTDLDRAAGGLRIPAGSTAVSPYNPYVEIIEALRRFDSQPLGRRAIVVVSNGLDVSRGLDASAPGQSLDLQRAITEAQRRGVAIYSIYAPAVGNSGNLFLDTNGQSCLERLSSETGGRAFFQGMSAPVSFDPFLKEIDASLGRQIALTYLSTHTAKGFHRLDIKPLERDVEIRHPAGYSR
jgi:VWFA-related protein